MPEKSNISDDEKINQSAMRAKELSKIIVDLSMSNGFLPSELMTACSMIRVTGIVTMGLKGEKLSEIRAIEDRILEKMRSEIHV